MRNSLLKSTLVSIYPLKPLIYLDMDSSALRNASDCQREIHEAIKEKDHYIYFQLSPISNSLVCNCNDPNVQRLIIIFLLFSSSS